MAYLGQTFYIYDMLGPLAVALLFAVIVLFLSFFVINFFLVSKNDDVTVFERVNKFDLLGNIIDQLENTTPRILKLSRARVMTIFYAPPVKYNVYIYFCKEKIEI